MNVRQQNISNKYFLKWQPILTKGRSYLLLFDSTVPFCITVYTLKNMGMGEEEGKTGSSASAQIGGG